MEGHADFPISVPPPSCAIFSFEEVGDGLFGIAIEVS